MITSASNPLIARIRAVASRKGRAEHGVFLTEGVGPVWRAVESSVSIDTLVVARPTSSVVHPTAPSNPSGPRRFPGRLHCCAEAEAGFEGPEPAAPTNEEDFE